MLKGVLHIHSTFSDGELTLAELRDLYRRAGCRFACVTDHADAFDPRRLRSYVEECRRLSDSAFRFVAGLEYGCDGRMHIIGYGVTVPVDSTDPEDVIRHIQGAGGLAVIAHPRDTAFAGIERFDPLPDGIEVWNSKYDGRYAPRPGTFALLERVQRRRPDVFAFYGQDLHWRRQYRRLYTLVDANDNKPGAVLHALATGRFAGLKDGRSLPAHGVLAPPMLAEFERRHRRSDHMRLLVRRVKAWTDGLGVAVPAPVKSQLRRIF